MKIYNPTQPAKDAKKPLLLRLREQCDHIALEAVNESGGNVSWLLRFDERKGMSAYASADHALDRNNVDRTGLRFDSRGCLITHDSPA